MPRKISPAKFEAIVEEALESLPSDWAERLDNVAIIIEDEPDVEELAELGLAPQADDHELLGLYQGTPQSVREIGGWGLPDRIVIFRGPTLREARHRSEIPQVVRETLLHEIGHHFGLDEDDLPF
jgi:predicted Zn-dependent protease with MMP-like domain